MPYASTVFAYHSLSVFCTIVLTEMLPEERAKPPALSLACLQLLNAECFVWVQERREKNPGKFVVLIMGLSMLIKKAPSCGIFKFAPHQLFSFSLTLINELAFMTLKCD